MIMPGERLGRNVWSGTTWGTNVSMGQCVARSKRPVNAGMTEEYEREHFSLALAVT